MPILPRGSLKTPEAPVASRLPECCCETELKLRSINTMSTYYVFSLGSKTTKSLQPARELSAWNSAWHPRTPTPHTLNHALLNKLKITFGGQAVEFHDIRMERSKDSPAEGGVQQSMRQEEENLSGSLGYQGLSHRHYGSSGSNKAWRQLREELEGDMRP